MIKNNLEFPDINIVLGNILLTPLLKKIYSITDIL